MENQNVSLFTDDGSKPIIPSVNIENISAEDKSLISDNINRVISGDMVKSIMIPEELDLITPNFVLDFREAKSLRKHQIHVLTTLISDDGDTAVYILLNNGMEKLGMGIGASLDKIVSSGIGSVFGRACTIYQNVERGKTLRIVNQADVSKIRLDL